MDSELIQFKCPNCEVALSVPSSMRYVSGPCPICAVVIQPPSPPIQVQPSDSKKSRRISKRYRRDSADTPVDFMSVERHDTRKFLRIIILILLVAGICYATLKYLQQVKAG